MRLIKRAFASPACLVMASRSLSLSLIPTTSVAVVLCPSVWPDRALTEPNVGVSEAIILLSGSTERGSRHAGSRSFDPLRRLLNVPSTCACVVAY